MDNNINKKEQATKRVSSSDIKRKTKSKKSNNIEKNGKKIKFRDKHPRIATTMKISIIALIVICIIAAGILVGAFYGLFGEELKISEEDLVIKYQNSTVYDINGEQIATLSGGTKRKIVSLSEMSEYLPKAYVAIEDERFYEHSGVDVMRTGKAVATYVFNAGSSSFGGSTITQQLIKNITNEKDKTALAGAIRKVKEISKAIQVEHYLSKDQILELYLNMIFVGGDDINGVALGAVYYFDKDVKDLSIAECAYLAGINHIPNAYKPFSDFANEDNPEEAKAKMTEKINKRTKTVLGKMKELTYINEEQYNTAIEEVDKGLAFKRGEGANVTTEISYHTEAALEEILDQIMAETDMNETMAEMYLYSSGLKIYTTQDTAIQNRLEEELANEDKYLKKSTYKDPKTGEKKSQTSMASMVIINHNTGEVVASGAGIGEERIKTKIGYFNIPTRLYKSTGSTMKPIAVIAPGLESGALSGATVYYDADTTFGGGYHPHNYYAGYRGLMNMRKAIEISANIPHVKALADVGVGTSIEFCESVGLPIAGDEGLSLGLGGLTNGVSVYQMTGAYAAIANDGVYKEPTFYTKVTDSEGNVLYTPKKEEKRVMSEQNAYILKNILQEPVRGGAGTATYCAIKGIDTAAKTGTTNDDYDRWLCGFTPYYTAACWYGYEFNAKVVDGGNPAGKIWDAVMTDIHEELPNAKFEEPDGIQKVSICRSSGLKSIEGCTDVYTEMFTKNNIPGPCDGHPKAVVCKDSGMLPTEFCPVHEERVFAYLPESERNQTKWNSVLTTKNPDGTEVELPIAPTDRCTMHTQPLGCQHEFSEWTTQSHNPSVQDRKCSKCEAIEYRDTPKDLITNTTEHKHNYTSKVTKAATCKAEGEKTLTCSCGDTKTEKIEKIGHKAGTAAANGEVKCTVCGTVIVKGKEEHKHNYTSKVTKAATCKAEGEKTLTCSCGDIKTEKIGKTGHTSGEPAANGEVKCTVCDTVLVTGTPAESTPEPSTPTEPTPEEPTTPTDPATVSEGE